MKSFLLLFSLLLGLVLTLPAQPDRLNYQTVVRNAQGQPLASQQVAFRMSIRQGSGTGTLAYQETHSVQTDALGLVNFQIGGGSSSGSLGDVDWTAGPYFLQVEVDPAGGTTYEDLGSTQLVSVPFALHAQTAAEVDDADADPSNELQTLSITDNVLSLSQGNSVNLPSPDPKAVAKAWVNFPIVGTPNLNFDAYNVVSTSVTATGVRVVTFPPGLFSPATNPAMVCQIRNDLAPGFCVVTSGAAPSQVTVRTYNANGTLADKEFSLIVFGR